MNTLDSYLIQNIHQKPPFDSKRHIVAQKTCAGKTAAHKFRLHAYHITYSQKPNFLSQTPRCTTPLLFILRILMLFASSLSASCLQSAKTYNIAFTFSLVFVAAIRKDIRPEETFTLRSPTLHKRSHCSPQRHTILLLDFLFVSVAAVRKDVRPEETCTFRSPTLNKHNHCSPQRHTILLFDFLLCS